MLPSRHCMDTRARVRLVARKLASQSNSDASRPENPSVPGAPENLRYRHHENFQIQQDVPVFNVFKIKGDILFKRRVVAGGHLPEACKSRRDVQAAKMLEIVSLEIVFRMGPRADHTHVALEHVEKLR